MIERKHYLKLQISCWACIERFFRKITNTYIYDMRKVQALIKYHADSTFPFLQRTGSPRVGKGKELCEQRLSDFFESLYSSKARPWTLMQHNFCSPISRPSITYKTSLKSISKPTEFDIALFLECEYNQLFCLNQFEICVCKHYTEHDLVNI